MTASELYERSKHTAKLLARLRSASKIAFAHFGISLLLSAIVAAWIFFVWFPYPFNELSHGKQLFIILIAVDVVCGPLLTLVLYDANKEKYKWHIDVAIIVTIQLCALAYGIHSLMVSRPVFLAFEGNRYRVVQYADIQSQLDENKQFPLPWGRPQLIGVQLAKSTDSDFLESIKLSLNGLPPAFRPSRWVPYESEREDVQDALKPLASLSKKKPEAKFLINEVLRRENVDEGQVGYLPLVQNSVDDWVVLVNRDSAMPVAFLQLDGWE